MDAQRLLRFLGYYEGRTDGIFDDALRDDVLAFQLEHRVIVSEGAPGAGLSLYPQGPSGGHAEAAAVAQTTRELQKQSSMLRELKGAYKTLNSTITAAFILPNAFQTGFSLGQNIASGIQAAYQEGVFNWLGRKWEEWTAPDLVATRQRNQAGREAAAAAQAEKEKQYNDRLKEEQQRAIDAELGPHMGQYLRDRDQYGEQKAKELAKVRIEAAMAEQVASDNRQKQLDEEQANQRRQEKLLADQKTVEDLKREVSEFSLSAEERRKAAVLRGIDDPKLRAEAGLAFDQRLAMESKKEQEEKNKLAQEEEAKRLADEKETLRKRRAPDAVDARTVGGWQALRDSVRGGPQQTIAKNSERQAKGIERVVALMEQNAQGGEGFDPFAA
jgi:hypothetical protein